MAKALDKAPTLQDVSRRAGVSAATVSRILSGSAAVGADKSSRVREAMKSLNYTPLRKSRRASATKAAKAAKAAGRTGVVAVVLFSDDVLAKYSNDLASTLRGVASALGEAGKTMLYCDLADGAAPPAAVLQGRVDGLLVAGATGDGGKLGMASARPTVWLTSHRDKGGATATLAGNEHVGQLAADHLIDLGCRRLATLEPCTGSPALDARGNYFCFTAAQAGVRASRIRGSGPLPRERDPDGWADLDAAVDATVGRMAALSPVPDGVLLSNPCLLGPVYAALRRRGLEPERDVRVVVCGHHEPIMAAVDPRPAAIDLRGEIIGRCAVQQLLMLIENPSAPAEVDLLIRPLLIRPRGDIEPART